MELGIWGSLWANCALGATFLALPTLVETPLFQQVNNEIVPVPNDFSIRNDHETQTAELSASDSASDSETQEESDQEQDDETEDDNTNGTDATNFIIKQDVNLNTSCDPVETETEVKDAKNDSKKKKPYQRIRYDGGMVGYLQRVDLLTDGCFNFRYGREEYRCTICSYTCTTERAFLKHLRFHASDENKEAQLNNESPRLSCPVCGKDRTGEAALNLHMQKHRDDKNFCCDICSFKTVQLKKVSFLIFPLNIAVLLGSIMGGCT